MIGYVVLIDIASRQDGNAAVLEITRRNIVARGGGPLIHRQNFTIRAGVKHVSGGGGDQRDIATDRGALDRWNLLQRRQSFFHETLARGGIGIGRLRQRHQASPHILGAEPDVLLAQLYEAGDKQRRARQQRDRERDLRTDQDFAEPVLLHAAARSASAFFQSFDQ